MAFDSTSIGDLIRTTLSELNRGKFTELATDRQKFIFTKEMMRKHKMTFREGGTKVTFRVMVDHNHSAAAVGLYNVDNLDHRDVMTEAEIRWAQYHSGFPVDAREITRNGGQAKIVDLMLTKRKASDISMIEKLEVDAWRVPATTDNVSMFGIPYWVVKNNTEGFNGAHPSGYSDVAGLSTTTYPRWKNYTAQYTAVTKDDLVAKMKRAAEFTEWMPPVEGIPDFKKGNDYGIYTNWAVLGTLNNIAEQQNDSLGVDIASMEGKTTFRGTPITRVPELENDTTNPVYYLCWGVWALASEPGFWMRETVVDKASDQHLVAEYHRDLTIQPICYDRRRQAVLATNTGLPA